VLGSSREPLPRGKSETDYQVPALPRKRAASLCSSLARMPPTAELSRSEPRHCAGDSRVCGAWDGIPLAIELAAPGSTLPLQRSRRASDDASACITAGTRPRCRPAADTAGP